MTTFTSFRMTVRDFIDSVRFALPARFLTQRNVAMLARIPSDQFQTYLWNVIDTGATDPEILWTIQAFERLLRFIRSLPADHDCINDSDYDSIVMRWCELGDNGSQWDERFLDAMAASKYAERFHREYC